MSANTALCVGVCKICTAIGFFYDDAAEKLLNRNCTFGFRVLDHLTFQSGCRPLQMQSLVLIADVSLGTIFCEALSHFQGFLIHTSRGAIFSEPLSHFQGTYDPSFSLALQCKDNRLGYQIATKHKVGDCKLQLQQRTM